MRLGCCVNMLVPLGQGTGAELVEKVAAAGFDYLELPLARIAALSDEEFDAVCRRVEDAAIRAEACNDFFPPELKLTGPHADLSDAIKYARHALGRAGRLGAKIVVFGSGPARMVPEGFSKTQAFDQLVRLLEEIAPVAAENGLVVAIEHLNRTECNIAGTLAEACQLAERVDRASVQVLADYYHLAFEQEPLEHVVDAGKRIRHVHCSVPAGRVYPRETDPSFSDFCHTLAEIGYDDRMSVEAYSEDFEIDAPAALRLLKSMFLGA
jgi:D-psicose/D-tagatose/L-ribulose 3-epimerase